ncbi:MAG: chromosome segregation protein SMC, partial [Clostridia bacterium]|nr:chromosome segregation protein SMC [Clostridia bacterium]
SKGGKKLEKDRLDATQSADKHQAEYDALMRERESLSQELTDVQIKVTSENAKIVAIRSENERLISAVKESEQSNVRLKQSNENALVMIEELKREQEKVALTKEEQEQVKAIRDEISGIEDYKLDLRKKQNENDVIKSQLTEQINELTEKKHTQEIALAKIDSDLEHLQQSVWEDYQQTYETAKEFRVENYNATEGEAEINRIRRKRNSLGAINASAIDDCKALKERYDEMIAQKEDLEKAEKDLKEAIDKIKAEMLTQFDEGFTKINENFQRIFKELFGGGRAMLEIDYTQVEDRLEAGVEIIAEPPGKKLQKLSLLSGGEKALTAIAILFAILKLRPMPFCVLDEVEAALDEANVDRFASYLRKFSEETQFIVITHKKPTMERANALFGVTMQEKGVSKLVSVKLSDVADITGDISLA